MKKVLLIVLCIAVLSACFGAFIACEKETETVISGYEIETKTYSIGDTYKSTDVKIVATLTDKSTIDVTENLVFDGDDKETIFLDEDGKFTKAGEYKIAVYKFEKRDDLKIGEWTIRVA